ncbi:MAG: hypothetical protein R2722_08270 [Tessaracoccus sp.]
MANRVLSVATIDELIARGDTQVQLREGDIVTPLARDYAAEKGVTIVSGHSDEQSAVSPVARTVPEPETSVDPAAVRQAVVAAFGFEPEGLDAAIAQALGEEFSWR